MIAKKNTASPAYRTLQFLKPIPVTEIPARAHRQHTSQILGLLCWPELEQVIEDTAKNGIVPFEAAAVIDLDEPIKQLKLKNPLTGIVARLRMLIKARKVESLLEVQVRGHRLYLVGA
jgi:hypothetical protein